MSGRPITLSLALVSGCITGQQPAPPVEPVTAAAEPTSPPEDPTVVLDGVYRLDVAAGLDAVDAALTAAGQADEAAEVRSELGGGDAWLVLDRRGETLLLYDVPGEAVRVEPLRVVMAGADRLAFTLQDRPDRAKALCQAASEVGLECDFNFDGSDLEVPLVLERASAADPGLPEPGIYRWQPALGMDEVADVESFQDSLMSSGLDPHKAHALATDLLSRPSLNIIAGDSLWTLNHAISWPQDEASEARIERGAYPLALMERTGEGFRIERRLPEQAGPIVEDCELMDAGFSCRSGGRESIYERITPRAR